MGATGGLPAGNPDSERDARRVLLVLALFILILAAFAVGLAGPRFGLW